MGSILPLSSEPSFYHPMYGGPNYGYSGLPGGGFAGAMAQAMLGGFMQSIGHSPLGVSPQNVYDRMNSIRLTGAHDTLMTNLASEAQGSIYDSLAGAGRLANLWKSDPSQRVRQEEALRTLSGTMSLAAPFMNQTLPPRVMDALGLGVMPMAENIFAAGRMRIDPLTGRMGLSSTVSEAVIRGVHQSLDGRSSLPLSMQGELFSDLQRRGMMPGSDGLGSALRQAGQDLGIDPTGRLSADDRQRLFDSPGVKSSMKTMEVTRTLKSYGGAVEAMREIFGDAGRPDAPVPELINALNALTSGGMSQYSPGQLEQMVRTTKNLAEAGGISLQGAMMLQQMSTNQAMAMGLPPVMAAGATQHALAFGSAYSALGQGVPVWGLSNVDDLRLKDMQLTASANQSQLANQMGAAMRMDAIGSIREGSQAAKLVADLRAGRGSRMSESDFVRTMSEGTGMSSDQVYRYLEQNRSNLEFVDKENLGGVVRRLQGQDYTAGLSQALGLNTQARLRNMGITGTAANQLGNQLARTAAGEIINMSSSDFADRETRNKNIANSLTERLRRTAAAGGANGAAAQQMLNRIQQDPSILSELSEELVGASELATSDPGGALAQGFGGMSLADARASFNAKTLDRAERNIAEQRGKSMFQSALSGLGKGTIVERGLRALQGVDERDPEALKKIFAQAIGAEPHDKIVQTLAESGVFEQVAGFADAESSFLGSKGREGGKALGARAAGFADSIEKFLEAAKANNIDLRTPEAKRRYRERLGAIHGKTSEEMAAMSEEDVITMAGGQEKYDAGVSTVAGISAAQRQAAGIINVQEGDVDFSKLSAEEQAKLLQNQASASQEQKITLRVEAAQLTIKDEGGTLEGEGEGKQEGRQ